MAQLEIFANSQRINEQVLIRLILEGIYPLKKQDGKLSYIINPQGAIIGTNNSIPFSEQYKDRELCFLGEGQMSEEDLKAVNDYNNTKRIAIELLTQPPKP